MARAAALVVPAVCSVDAPSLIAAHVLPGLAVVLVTVLVPVAQVARAVPEAVPAVRAVPCILPAPPPPDLRVPGLLLERHAPAWAAAPALVRVLAWVVLPAPADYCPLVKHRVHSAPAGRRVAVAASSIRRPKKAP